MNSPTPHPDSHRAVVVVGDVQPDFTFRLAADGGLTSGPDVAGGGAAANTAVALARLGVRVRFVGRVGDDPLGQKMIEELEAEGIDTSLSQFDPTEPTAQVFALLRPDGEAALARWPQTAGADWNLKAEDIPSEPIRSAGWVHTTGISLTQSPAREAVLHALCLARSAGVPVSFDLNFRREQRTAEAGLRAAFDEAIALSTVVIGHGRDELMAYTSTASVPEASRALGGDGRTVVARMGAQGAVIFGAGDEHAVPALPTQVLNTVGAGDAFNGGYIAASLMGLSAQEAGRWGCAVAALKIARGGARALPSRHELGALLNG